MNLPKGSCFLFGPRGTGKSTWIEAERPDALRVDLLDQAAMTVSLSWCPIWRYRHARTRRSRRYRLVHAPFAFLAACSALSAAS